MLDRAAFWTAPAAYGQGIDTADLQVRLLPAMPQIMISGDLAAGLARFGLQDSLGLMAQTAGARYALRLARGRALVVGTGIDAAQGGWHAGVALTPMTGALAVLEITGPQALEMVARASAVDLRLANPCAALSFAGVTSILYRHGDALRLHLDAGLVPYMLDWIAASGAAAA